MSSLTKHFKDGLPAMENWSRLSSLVTTVLGANSGPFTLTGTNTYLVGRGRRRILIDAGEGKDAYLRNLREAMHSVGCVEVSDLVLTHYHYDHIGGVPSVLSELGEQTRVWKFPLGARDSGAPPLSPEGVAKADLHAQGLAALPEGVRELRGGQELEVEGATLRVMHTPGHTADHAALWLQQERSVFSGDCVLGIGSGVFEDLAAYMRSLHQLLELRPARLYPGHGPDSVDAVGLIRQYIAHREERERQVVEAMQAHAKSEALSVRDLVDVVYEDVPEKLRGAAASNLRLVLTKLEGEAKAHCEGGEGLGQHWRLRGEDSM